MDEDCGDRAVDPARQSADDLSVTNLGTDVGDLLVAIGAHRPIAGAAADVPREIGQQAPAVGGVHDFGMEHHRIEAARFVGGDRIGGTLRSGDDGKAVGQLLHPVAMAHPHLVTFALLPKPVEQGAIADHLDEGAAEFAIVGCRDNPAQLMRHGLLPVTDGEYGKAGVEEVLWRPWAVFPHHRRRSAGKDDPLGRQPLKGFRRGIERRDLAINARLAHPPGDQLRHLAAEVDDEDGVGGMRRHGEHLFRAPRAGNRAHKKTRAQSPGRALFFGC